MQKRDWAVLDQVKLMFQMPNLAVYRMDEVVAEEAAGSKAAYNIKIPDAIMAATPVVRKADVLLTDNYSLAIIKKIQAVSPEKLRSSESDQIMPTGACVHQELKHSFQTIAAPGQSYRAMIWCGKTNSRGLTRGEEEFG